MQDDNQGHIMRNVGYEIRDTRFDSELIKIQLKIILIVESLCKLLSGLIFLDSPISSASTTRSPRKPLINS